MKVAKMNRMPISEKQDVTRSVTDKAFDCSGVRSTMLDGDLVVAV